MLKAQREAAAGVRPTVEEFRTGFDLIGQMMPPVTGVQVKEVDVAGMPGVRLVPEGAPSDRVILYLHGGGYAIGSRTSHTPLVANLAKAARIEVVLPEYRLAPENPFPAAVDDALAAYQWVLDQGVAPERIVVAGESAGGGLTLALLVSLRDAKRPLPAAAVAISPWCDVSAIGEMTKEALEIDFLTPDALEQFAGWYADEATRKQPLCSPIFADLSGLPPLLIQAGECEILSDQDRRLAALAKDAGVDVMLEVEPGMFHAWPLFAGMLPEADEAIARIASFVRAKFG